MSGKNSNDFDLTLSKEWVKQGRQFTSKLESSKQYGKQKVFWELSGDEITPSIFDSGKLKGKGKLKKKGSFKHTFEIARNNELSGNTTLNIAYYFDKKRQHKIADDDIQIIAKAYDPEDDPNQPWKLTATRIDDIKENVAVRAKITNGEPGKIVYFQLTGAGLDQNDLDLSYGRMSGQAQMDAEGEATIPFMIRADNKTEGTEVMTFSFYEDSGFTKPYGSFSLDILDESVETAEQGPTLSPIPTQPQPIWSGTTPEGTWFTIAPSRSEIQENQSTRTRINSNSEVGNVLYFKISGEGIDQDDFDLSYGRTSGSIVINQSSTAFIPHLLRNDNKTEGTEEMTVSLYRDPAHTALVATATVPIRDTSTQEAGQLPTLSPIPTTAQPQWGGGVDEGSWFTLSPGRASYPRGIKIGMRIDSDSLPGAELIWKLSGPGVTSNDIEPSAKHDGLTGSAKIGLNGFATFDLTFKPSSQITNDTLLSFDLYRDDPSNEKLASTSLLLTPTPNKLLRSIEPDSPFADGMSFDDPILGAASALF